MLPRVMLARDVSVKAKVEAFFHLTCFSVHAFAALLVFLSMPVMLIRMEQAVGADGGALRALIDWTAFGLATVSASVFYVTGQYELFRDWRTVLKYLPFLMALGVGVSLSNTKAMLEALFGRGSEFVRTPKYGDTDSSARRRSAGSGKRNILPLVELSAAIYMAACAVYCFADPKLLMAGPFYAIFTVGFGYVSIQGLRTLRIRSKAPALQAGESDV